MLAVLVVATPCPLVLAAPVAIVSGIACAARNGVVVKDGAALEAMGQTRTVLLDKTGTLTAGRAHVVAVVTAPDSEAADVLALAASVEQASPHVLAAMLVREAGDRGLMLHEPTAVVEQAGSGVGGIVGGHQVWVGALSAVAADERDPWLTAAERRARREGCSATVVLVDGEPVGMILFTDELRTDTSAALRALRRAGVDRVVMVTGDRLEVAEPIGMSLGLDQVFADRTPTEKLDVVRAESSTRSGITVMVGDGVNDAPALAAADLGVAMGARGATASSEAADVVLIVDRLDRMAVGVVIASAGDRAPECAAGHGPVAARDGRRGGRTARSRRRGDRPGGHRRAGDRHGVAGAAATAVVAARRIGAGGMEPSARERTRTGSCWSSRIFGRWPCTWTPPTSRLRSPHCAMSLHGSPRRWSRTSEAYESHIYPGVAERSGGNDPLAPMSRTHQEIFHLASLLDRLVDDASAEGFGDEDRSEARRILYALDAFSSGCTSRRRKSC